MIADIDNDVTKIITSDGLKIEPLNKQNVSQVKIMFNLETLNKITIDVLKNVIILHGDKEIVL